MARVSVVIPTHLRPEALQRAIRSALAQTITDIEVVVAIERDDPGALDIVAAINDPRVHHVVNVGEKGPGPNRDSAVRVSRGEWIAFLDDDDEWLPTKLERQLALADERTIVMSLYAVVSPSGTRIWPTRPYAGDQPVDEWLFDRHSWFRSGEAILQTSALLVPRTLFDVLSFGTVRHEEWELVIRAVKQHGYRLVTVGEPLVRYYTGSSYPWAPSVAWVRTMREVLTPRAFSGFCLRVATQGISGRERNRAFWTLFKTAWLGRPTAKQLFAFAVFWVVPETVREKVRGARDRA